APLHSDMVHLEYRQLAEPFEKRMIIAGLPGSRRALENKEAGIFALSVLHGLDGAADEAGGGRDGLISARELATYLKTEYGDQSSKVDDNRLHKNRLIVDGYASVTLVRNPEDRKPHEELVKKFQQVAARDKLPGKYLAEGTSILERLPVIQSSQQLRKLYEQLATGKLTSAAFQEERDGFNKKQALADAEVREYVVRMYQALGLIRFRHREPLDWRDLARWSAAGLFRAISADMPVALRKQLEQVKSSEDTMNLLTEARLQAGRHAELDNGADISASLVNVLDHIDIRAEYLDKQKVTASLMLRERVAEVGLIFYRLGLGKMEVVTAFKDSPGYKAGIRAGDIVTRFENLDDEAGKPLDKPRVLIPTSKTSNDELSNFLAGRPGTRLRLTVIEKGTDKPKEITLTRAPIHRETLLGVRRRADDSWNYLLDPKEKIYYVEIPTFFGRTTAEDLASLLASFEKQGMKGLILDLRSNPGGALKQAIDVCDLLINDGTLLQVKCRSRRDVVYPAKEAGSFTQFPIVVLVDHATASSAEVVASCLQDHGRAIIVGERTLGKGSVQEYFPFNGGQIKVTTGATYRGTGQALDRDGNWTEQQSWGVIPDRALPLSHQEYDRLKDAKNADWIFTREPRKEEPVTDRHRDLALKLLKEKIGGK
ncbi:MAG: S41 family peptidase, partial [Gemmataceae bacterium]